MEENKEDSTNLMDKLVSEMLEAAMEEFTVPSTEPTKRKLVLCLEGQDPSELPSGPDVDVATIHKTKKRAQEAAASSSSSSSSAAAATFAPEPEHEPDCELEWKDPFGPLGDTTPEENLFLATYKGPWADLVLKFKRAGYTTQRAYETVAKGRLCKNFDTCIIRFCHMASWYKRFLSPFKVYVVPVWGSRQWPSTNELDFPPEGEISWHFHIETYAPTFEWPAEYPDNELREAVMEQYVEVLNGYDMHLSTLPQLTGRLESYIVFAQSFRGMCNFYYACWVARMNLCAFISEDPNRILLLPKFKSNVMDEIALNGHR